MQEPEFLRYSLDLVSETFAAFVIFAPLRRMDGEEMETGDWLASILFQRWLLFFSVQTVVALLKNIPVCTVVN